MNPKLDATLVARYPKIFKNRYGDPRTTLMCWGFDCGDGWFTLLNELCSNIQSHINSTRGARAAALRYNRALSRALNGDAEALLRYYTHRPDLRVSGQYSDHTRRRVLEDVQAANFRAVPPACAQAVAAQVKEKFGTLRFYYDGGDDVIDGMVRMAEGMSAHICEVCGDAGEERGGTWVTTTCAAHAPDSSICEQTFTLEVQEHEDGELFLEFPPELMERAGISVGDTVVWTVRPDGSVELTKKETT